MISTAQALLARYRALGGDVILLRGAASAGIYTRFPSEPSEAAESDEQGLREAIRPRA